MSTKKKKKGLLKLFKSAITPVSLSLKGATADMHPLKVQVTEMMIPIEKPVPVLAPVHSFLFL